MCREAGRRIWWQIIACVASSENAIGSPATLGKATNSGKSPSVRYAFAPPDQGDIDQCERFLRGAFPKQGALDNVFIAVDRPNVRRISIEIRSPNAKFRLVLVDPLPKQFRCDPSFITR